MGHPTESGIYRIRNAVNGRSYIGSSIRLPRRWAEHRKALNEGCHHNTPLQRAWDRYGSSSFTFEVLEKAPLSVLIERERWWIDSSESPYNIAPAGRPGAKGISHSHGPDDLQPPEWELRIREHSGLSDYPVARATRRFSREDVEWFLDRGLRTPLLVESYETLADYGSGRMSA